MKCFRDSQEDAYRRLIREAVKRGPYTRAEKDIVRCIVNLWLHHRKKEGVIRPGAELLAKRSKTSEATVRRSLRMLREVGILIPVKYANGGRNATRYRLEDKPLFDLANMKAPIVVSGALAEIHR